MSDAHRFDESWKQALDLYLQPFTELCFPAAARDIDWDVEFEFLDKELQQLVPGSNLGRQYVDKLVKVQRRDGAPEWILIHVEVQAQYDRNLPKRVYQYHHRIADRFGRRAVTLVVLADQWARWRPAVYEEEELWGCRMRFDYPVCKLLDFAGERAAELERWKAARNPAAVMVEAHLATYATRKDAGWRKSWRTELSQSLYELGYSRKDVQQLVLLIGRLMALPRPLELEFCRELIRYEEQKAMPYISSFERFARQEGREEATVSLLIRQARKRFAKFASGDEAAIRGLPLGRLEDLSEALLDFSTIDDLRQWLSRPGRAIPTGSNPQGDFSTG